MTPEDVKPITEIGKLIRVEGLQPARNPDSSWSLEGAGSIVPCIPAHEVGAIIKSAIDDAEAYLETAYESWHSNYVIEKRKRQYLEWLAKAGELENLK